MVFCITFFVLISINAAFSSQGDTSKFYSYCLFDCKRDICAQGRNVPITTIGGLPLSLWTCEEDCDYMCQWKTVDAFLARNWPVPQFHGKWPFLRVLGLQEPASAIFSYLNLVIVFLQLRHTLRVVPEDSTYLTFWQLYSGVCINSWIWSAVYHARDTYITEKLDYIAASVMVFASFFAMTIRVFELGMTIRTAIWNVICICILVNHIAYLWFFKFDYGYNMLFNVIVGGMTVIGWVSWAFINKEHPGRGPIVAYCVLMAASTILEVLDFPPIFWVLDAHALWHCSTAFIIPFFYRFIRSDCMYLKNLTSLPTQRKFD